MQGLPERFEPATCMTEIQHNEYELSHAKRRASHTGAEPSRALGMQGSRMAEAPRGNGRR